MNYLISLFTTKNVCCLLVNSCRYITIIRHYVSRELLVSLLGAHLMEKETHSREEVCKKLAGRGKEGRGQAGERRTRAWLRMWQLSGGVRLRQV